MRRSRAWPISSATTTRSAASTASTIRSSSRRTTSPTHRKTAAAAKALKSSSPKSCAPTAADALRGLCCTAELRCGMRIYELETRPEPRARAARRRVGALRLRNERFSPGRRARRGGQGIPASLYAQIRHRPRIAGGVLFAHGDSLRSAPQLAMPACDARSARGVFCDVYAAKNDQTLSAACEPRTL